MDKSALLNVDPKAVGRYALGGLITGGASAALLNLVHNIRELSKERKAQQERDKPDENTIVLTIPSKQAEIHGSPSEPHKIKIHEGSKITTRFLREQTKGKQARHYTGEYGSKIAAHGWPTLTAASLAALGSGVVGASLVDKIYQQRREKQLKKDLELAKQEYMTALVHGKSAEALDDLFPSFNAEKQADGDSSFGAISYPMAAAAILTILGAGGTGYLTKKILDAKLQESKEQGLDVPKVKRIVLQSAPSMDATKHASAEEVESVKAAFALIFDYVGGTRVVLDDPAFVKAAADAGVKPDDVAQKVADDAQDAMAFLRQHPGLMDAASGKLLAHNPIKRMLAHTGPGRAYAVRRVGDMVSKLNPGVKAAQTAGAGGFGGSAGGNQSPTLKKQPLKKRVRLGMPWQKTSQDLQTLAAMSPATKAVQAIVGGNKENPEALAKALANEQERRESAERTQGLKEPGTVRIEARGSEAEKYLNEHQKNIVSVVRRLAAEGQI